MKLIYSANHLAEYAENNILSEAED